MKSLLLAVLLCACEQNIPTQTEGAAGAAAQALLSPWNPKTGENWVQAVLQCESELIPGTSFAPYGGGPLGAQCISSNSYAICVNGVYDSSGMTYGTLFSQTFSSPITTTYLAKVATLSSQQAIVPYGRIDWFPWALGNPTQPRWAHCDTLPGSSGSAILNMQRDY